MTGKEAAAEVKKKENNWTVHIAKSTIHFSRHKGL
jgi:hypothetical protein